VTVRPVHAASDGWEYWEVACLDRNELNKLVQAARTHYSGVLFSLREEKLKGIARLALVPELTEKQLEALQLAYKEGYYTYPRSLTIPQIAKMLKKSYSTFQESLRKAENKVIEHFMKYR
jgi:predicted DNA binding protein